MTKWRVTICLERADELCEEIYLHKDSTKTFNFDPRYGIMTLRFEVEAENKLDAVSFATIQAVKALSGLQRWLPTSTDCKELT